MRGYMHFSVADFRKLLLAETLHYKDGICCLKKGSKFIGYYFAYGVVVEVESIGRTKKLSKEILFREEFFLANDVKVIKIFHMEEFLTEMNDGEDNAGVHNYGAENYGDNNRGDTNYGNDNFGDGNYGNLNSGAYNWGNFNLGNENYGNDNLGNCNYGDYNSGSFNYGDFNSGEFSYGCFNENAYGKNFIRMFDKVSSWTYEDWISSPARKIMITLMNSKDKQNKWNNLPPCDKEEIKSLPNFDSEIFFRTTGIKVD